MLKLYNYHRIKNILQKSLNPNCNILYESSYSIFDLIIRELDINIYNIENDKNSYIPIDCFAFSDIMKAAHAKTLSKQLHVHGIFMIHQPVPPHFKKEDILLCKQHLEHIHKIYMSPYLANSWNIQDKKTYTIPYGIPVYGSQVNNHKKDILVLNLHNNEHIQNLYLNIKQIFQDTDILSSIQHLDLANLNEIIASYKICIDINSIINSLFVCSRGSYIITNMPNIHNLYGSFAIQNFANIREIIIDILNKYDTQQIINNIEYIQQNMSIDTFNAVMTDICIKIKQDPFVI